MAEIYTPTEQTQGPSLGRSLAITAGSVAFERSTTVGRTMRHGASLNNGFANTWLGWKQTADEMERFSNPKHGAMNWRRWVPGGGKMLGSAWAPSTWMVAADMIDGSGSYTENMLNLAEGKSWGASRRVVKARGTSPTMGSWTQYRTYDAATEPLNMKGAYDSVNRLRRNQVVNSFLGGGAGANTQKNLAMDLMWGSWFKPGANAGLTPTGAAMGPINTAAYGPSKYGWINAIKGRANTGFAMRAAGAEGVAGITKLASFSRTAFSIGGAALKGYNYATMAYYGGKLAYKGWETFAIKAPMAAYQAVGRQLTRGAFSSGDASLLTGIPANNRMRAVQAIQGSRMNARSALGSEASLLAGHFG